ncbi:putative ATP-dependent transcriptional regulator, MalT-like, LuxR family [Candidatus Promineifilum breve]|uniref:ATP-dependent transcriptional regulator, MalT-like, LuxR family n=1 Tax=Candidatus Promineifilum breve TaxID=1806508 RepID=A0A170PG37_9CHLR|nr:LuxR C-terminal-related transcriptional regulator [Candidatus Promineifilum breve]CUS03517.2 putative ATP-dependent transcriptional regulator, MalT-like, LuxR family [Candidatus Promineifilum breve]
MKPVLKEGVLWTGEALTAGAPPLVHGSAHWHEWLGRHNQFQFEGSGGHFSARRENRKGSDYWYAYRRRAGILHKAYLGRATDMTLERLEEVAANLAGRTVLAQLSLGGDAPGQLAAETWSTHTSFFIQAKFRPPVLPPTLVTRPRLTGNLNAPVTFVSAPGGFGKSTLLNAWRQERAGMPVAWAALDSDDDQLLRFWSTVITALQTVQPGLGQMLMPFLQRASAITPAEIVSRLTDELVCEDGHAFCLALVLDDFHHIRQADVHDSVQIFLEHLPPTLQLIIAGRTRPPLALGRLRAMGLVTELELDDLRFTLPEGIAFLQQNISGEPLAYGDMEALVKRTGGWVVGLKLAVLALNKQQDRRHVLDSFSGAHIFLRDYFMETALRQRSEGLQTFLLKTSILKQMAGGLCDAVTGRSDGEEMLARLWQENLFITRTEDRKWFRYHDLFAEMLRNQIQRELPDEIATLHRRAAAWYVAQNMSADAVHHLLFIKDWETAAEVIEDVGLRELAESGEDSRLLRWVQRLPETVVQRHTTLLFVYLRLANLALPRDEVIRFLQRIEQNLVAKAPAEMTASEREVLDEVRQIRPRLTKGAANARFSTGHIPDPRWQLLDALLITETFNQPKTEEVGARVREIYDQARAEGNLFATILAGTDLSNRALMRGQLRQSEKIAYQVVQQGLTQRGHLPEPSSIALSLLAQVCLGRNELAQAHQFLDRALVVDPNPTSSNMPVTIAIIRARLQSAAGQHAEAQATIQAARTLQTLRPSGSWGDQDLAAYEARFSVRQGHWAAAGQLLKASETEETHALSELVRAEILLARGQLEDAETLLTQFVAQYAAGFPNEPSLDARVMLAQALFAQFKMNQARRVLAEAVQLAAPESFIRPFLDHGRGLAALLALMRQTPNLPAESARFIDEILIEVGHHDDAFHLPPDENLDSLAVAASITTREQEVLRLLCEGLPNREIAARLCVSPGTVKTHLTNIYGKLGVKSRVQAVAEARALKLI